MYVALCLFKDQFSHIKPVENALAGHVQFIYTSHWQASEVDRVKPDILIGINEHHVGVAECYAFAKMYHIPTLTLQDGILEWRHMFENPLYNGVTGPALHSPVLADKIACIGLTSAALIGALGNWHKVELIGMPKLDELKFTGTNTFRGTANEKKQVLVLTSSKPWFNDEQREVVTQELLDLKAALAQLKHVDVVWRVTKDLPQFLGVKNSYTQKSTLELAELIRRSDAVVTTISTTILESQLLEKPTAILDYFNTSNFVGTRWAIRHCSQLDSVLKELLNPTPRDKVIQDFFLHQNIVVGVDSAAHRTGELIKRMIQHKQEKPGHVMPANLLKMSLYPTSIESEVAPLPIYSLPDSNLWEEVINRLKYQNQQLEDKLNRQSFYGLLQRLKRLLTK